MTDQPKIPECYIQIVFAGAGSADFMPNMSNNITPFQLFAVAEYLRLVGEAAFMNQMIHQQQEAARNKIEVPGNNFKGVIK
jgi:hypothetical protein